MNPTDYGRSIVRTVVPIIVGSLIAWLAARGIKVDEGTILPAVDAIVAGAYYALIRLIEHRWPKAGWLLGSPGAPSYAPTVAPNASPAVSGTSPTIVVPGGVQAHTIGSPDSIVPVPEGSDGSPS